MAAFDETPVEVFADVHAEVGEGPHWDAATETLVFVDLTGGVVYRYDHTGTQLSAFDVGQAVGAVVPRTGGGLLLAVRDGVATTTDSGDAYELVLPIERETPSNRMNDAKCDPTGRFFAGTMAFDFSPEAGVLYRIEPDLSCTPMLRDLTISNGLGWSPDARRMYFIDSPKQGVDVYDYDVDTGTMSNGRPVVAIDPSEGVPDGMTVDADGNLWVACFAGSAVRCYSPSGELVRVVTFPVSQITSCAFGGPDLDLLYVTSGAFGLSADQLKREPHAGATFVCRPGAVGLPGIAFAG